MAAAVDPGWSMMGWTFTLFVAGELVMGQVVEPLVYGHSTGLSPVSVVVAAVFWGWIWGPIGLILSMPLTLCLVVLGRHFGRLEFLDVLFGDQPALTPVQSFYQGMLAGNLDEVQDTADQMLRNRPLSSYYDDVAVKGLQLAALDIERGVLGDHQVARMADAIDDLLGELADHGDEHPAPHPTVPVTLPVPVPAAWSAPSAVLCIAGRGPLDGTVAAMLAQLLGKHGLGARAEPYEVVASRAALAAIDVTGVMMVCLCHASVNATPANLRYAVLRLRHRLPAATVLVSLWPTDLTDEDRLRAAVGADRYAVTLRQAVVACEEQAAIA
jgi:hypothetical protein